VGKALRGGKIEAINMLNGEKIELMSQEEGKENAEI
jgi:hypothetical protein